MRLYLVQHGEAASDEVNPKRPLTDKGRADAAKVAEFLAEHGVCAQAVWHSTKLRARETAGIMAQSLHPEGGTQEREGFAPKDPVRDVGALIEAGGQDLMIVGHLPFLSKLASLLIAGDESSAVVGFRQGGVVCLEREDGNWTVAWMVTPELLRR